MLPAGDSQGVQRNISYCAPKRQQAWNWAGGGGQGFAWKFIGYTPYSPDFVTREFFILLTF